MLFLKNTLSKINKIHFVQNMLFLKNTFSKVNMLGKRVTCLNNTLSNWKLNEKRVLGKGRGRGKEIY